MKKFFTSFVVMALVMPQVMSATDYFVSVDGAGDKDGTSWENAAQASEVLTASFINNLSSGDGIYLMAGTYKMPKGTLTFPAGVTLQGGYSSKYKGTNTEIEYMDTFWDTTILDCDNSIERTAPVLKVQGSTNISGVNAKKQPHNRFLGFTLANARIKQASGYGSPAIYLRNAAVEMGYVKVLDNEITGTTNGGVTAVINGYFYAHDCTWSGNKCYSVAPALRFSYSSLKNACLGIVERCEFSDNTLQLVANNYGGALAVADDSGTLYMVNCTVKGTEIVKGGAMARIGGNCTFVSISNTWYDCTCSGLYGAAGTTEVGQHLNGVILSSGTSSTTRIANTIAVNKTDFAAQWKASHPSIDVKKYTSLYIQSGTSVFDPYGYNVFASVCDEANTSNIPSTNDINVDNLTAKVFGTDTPEFGSKGGNSTKVSAPVEQYRITPLADLVSLKDEWSLPEEIDLSLDQRGCLRSELTYAGSYDPAVISGIDAVTVNHGNRLSIVSAGNGHYAINGYEGDIAVYTVSGIMVKQLVVSAGDLIDLANLTKGVYIIKAADASARIVR